MAAAVVDALLNGHWLVQVSEISGNACGKRRLTGYVVRAMDFVLSTCPVEVLVGHLAGVEAANRGETGTYDAKQGIRCHRRVRMTDRTPDAVVTRLEHGAHSWFHLLDIEATFVRDVRQDCQESTSGLGCGIRVIQLAHKDSCGRLGAFFADPRVT